MHLAFARSERYEYLSAQVLLRSRASIYVHFALLSREHSHKIPPLIVAVPVCLITDFVLVVFIGESHAILARFYVASESLCTARVDETSSAKSETLILYPSAVYAIHSVSTCGRPTRCKKRCIIGLLTDNFSSRPGH